MKKLVVGFLVALIANTLSTALYAKDLNLTASPSFIIISGKRYAIISKGDTVTFTTAPSTAATFSWVFTNGDTPTGSGTGPFSISYSSSAAQGIANDVIFSSTRQDTHNGNPVTCTTTGKTTADVLVPKFEFSNNQTITSSGVDNYIAANTAVSGGKIMLTTHAKLTFGVSGVSVGTLSSNEDSNATFSPTSGTSDPFTTEFSSTDNSDQISMQFVNASPAGNTVKSDKRNMTPAVYQNMFALTAYTTPQESDPAFTGSTVTTTQVGFSSIKQYYYITSSIAVKEDFLQKVALEGYGYHTSYGGTLLQATPTLTSTPSPLPSGTTSAWAFYNVSVTSVSGLPLGNNNNSLQDGVSCAIVRDGSKTGTRIPSSTSTTAAITITNWGSKSADDKVTDAGGNYHIDMYYVNGYTYSQINNISDTQSVVLQSY